MESMQTSERLCMFRFAAAKFRDECVPFPHHVLTTIDRHLPMVSVARNENLQETMRDALKQLDRDPASVEEFIEHLAILSRINHDLPALETEFTTVTRLFTIIAEFNLAIDPEQYAFYKSLGSTFHHLKVLKTRLMCHCLEKLTKC